MKNKWTLAGTTGLLSCCCLLLFAVVARGQQADAAEGETITELLEKSEEKGFETWDSDSDGQLNPDEFYSYAQKFFDQWDEDADAALRRGEWKSAISQHYGFREYIGEFGEWDLDGNRNLSKKEFTVGLFRLFDSDGDRQIQPDEFNYWTWESPSY